MTIDKELAIAALCSRSFAEGGDSLTYTDSDELAVAVVKLAAEVLRLREELFDATSEVSGVAVYRVAGESGLFREPVNELLREFSTRGAKLARVEAVPAYMKQAAKAAHNVISEDFRRGRDKAIALYTAQLQSALKDEP